MKPAALIWIAAMMCLTVGCGPGEEVRPEVYPAMGTLTVNGEPAEGARIVLHPVSGENFDSRGSRPSAVVQADGTFRVTTYGDGDGAPAGEYIAAVLWMSDPESSNAWDKLGGRYVNPANSDLRVTVRDGDNRLPAIEIEGARLVTQRPSREKDLDQVE